MPLARIQIKAQPAGVGVRLWRAASKAGHLAMGKYWLRNFSPRHFQPGAARRYQYRPRSKFHRTRKARLQRAGIIAGGADDALVFRGNLRDAALLANLRAFPTRVKISRQVPSYATTHYRPGRPNLGDEQLRVTATEAEQLARVLDRTINRELKAKR